MERPSACSEALCKKPIQVSCPVSGQGQPPGLHKMTNKYEQLSPVLIGLVLRHRRFHARFM